MTEIAEANISETPEPQPRKRVPRGARVGIGVLVAAAVVAPALLALHGSPDTLSADPIGVSAPNFTLPVLGGSNMSLASLRGHPVVVNFFASWCDVCKQEAPVLAAGSKQWEQKGVVFLGIDSQDSQGPARTFLQQNGLTYRAVFDPAGRVMSRWGVTGFPESYFLDENGVIRAKWIGAISSSQLASDIQEAMPGSGA
jgi:cytochrome c biogenesis protein CcmG/thiol:disulfide interchange protein DsbE